MVATSNDRPFLSIIMPVHDGADWIGATLDSLCDAPSAGLEIIVLDSSPTADTSEIVDRYADRLPLRLIERKDLRPWQMKTNLGVELAAADHVCMLHQDDLWLRNRIEAVRGWIESFPDCVLHLAPTAMIDRNGRRLGSWKCPLPVEAVLQSDFLLERLMVQNFVSVPAPVFRRNAWLACGGMDPALWYTADWDIWAKLAASGPVVYHDEVTTAFRVHGSSLTVTGSRNAEEFRSQMETVLNRHIQRLPAQARERVEPAARASIDVNVSLAAASGGASAAILQAMRSVLSLGPAGVGRYLRDSRFQERVLSRAKAKFMGAF